MMSSFLLRLLTSPHHLSRFRREVHTYLLPPHLSAHADDLRFNMSLLKANPFIQGVWKESLRLGVTSAAARVVTQDSIVEGYVLEKGSVLLLPVRLMHFDADVFDDPDSFVPERWIVDPNDAEAAAKQSRQNNSLRPFGGGTGMCSGRYIAEMEVLSTAATLLLLFDIELEAGQEVGLNPRALGVMEPLRDPKVRIRRREEPRGLPT